MNVVVEYYIKLVLLTVAFCLGSISSAAAQEIRSGAYAYSIATASDWVTKGKTIKKSPADKNTRFIKYYLLEKQTNISKGQEHYIRTALEPLTLEAVESSSKIQINFNAAYHSLAIHSIKVHRNNVTIDKLSTADLKLVHNESDIKNNIYSEIVTALIILSDIRVGDIIEYDYTLNGSNPVFGDKFFNGYEMGWQVSVERVSVKLVAPVERKIAFQAIGINIEPVITENKGLREYVWILNNTAVITDEGEYPRWYDPYPWLQITEYHSWDQIKQWTSSLYRDDYTLTSPLQSLVKTWKTEHPNDPVKQAARALSFVQDEIRYFGVEYATNSHVPSDPNDVYTRRYGDCKDKSQLFVALLSRLNIQASPALVSTRYSKGIKNWLPTPSAFDHVIVKVDINGTSYWVDPTMQRQSAFFNKIPAPSYGYSLIIDDESGALEKIAADEKRRSAVSINEHYTVGEDLKPTSLVVHATYQGQMAEDQRQRISRVNTEDLVAGYVNYYAKLFSGVRSTQTPEISDNVEKNVVIVEMKFSIDHYFKENGDWLQYEAYPYTLKDYVALPKTMERKMPLAIYHPVKINHKVLINFPSDAPVKARDDVLELSDAHIEYQREIHIEKHRLSVDYTYASKRDAVLPINMNKHVDLLKQISDSLSLVGSFRNPRNIEQREKRADLLFEDLMKKLP